MRRQVCFLLCLFMIFWSTLAIAQGNPKVDDPNCGAPNLMLVVDTSGSMTQAGKIDALKIAIEDAVLLFKSKLRFGLISFSNGTATEQVPIGPAKLSDPAQAAAHAKKIIDAAKALIAVGDTPMTTAMRLALKKYQTEVIPPDTLHKDPDPKTQRRCYVLLMTDGEPTDGNPKDPIVAMRTLQVGAKTYDVKTFVVGLGSGNDIRAFQLNEYAKAGGTSKFYHATSKADLADIFKTISRDVSKTVEECNGRDDNCDGRIDEDIKRDCKSVCGTGVEVCNKGQWSACNAPKAQAEVCDGHDNDCNGQIDETLARKCETPCGQGNQSCIHGDWSTCSAPRPEPEVCNGKDDDCDGQIDNALKACPGGKCVKEGEKVVCDLDCKGGECPKGFLCDQGTNKCKELPCRRFKCPAGQICVNRPNFTHECVDPCQGKSCEAGKTCGRGGTCINCYQSACAPGLVCLEGRCTLDQCESAKCAAGQGCRDGKCFDTCGTKKCPVGQICQTVNQSSARGVCIADPCYGVACEKGESCVAGKCITNKCIAAGAKDCGPGQICEPITGLCSDNPCQRTHCPEGTTCKNGECVTGGTGSPAPNGACVQDSDCAGVGEGYVCKNTYCVPGAAVSGGSCNCFMLPGQSDPSNPIFLFMILFGYFFVARRVRQFQGK